MMSRSDIRQLIVEDLENKKSYRAKWSVDCSNCGTPIDQGEDFYFFGRSKICTVCYMEISEAVSVGEI